MEKKDEGGEDGERRGERMERKEREEERGEEQSDLLSISLTVASLLPMTRGVRGLTLCQCHT